MWCCSSTTTPGTPTPAWDSTWRPGSRPTRSLPCSPSGWSTRTRGRARAGTCRGCRSAYLEAGGLPEQFFFAHEEIDLAWRLLEAGYRLEYDAEARMCHPAVPNSRHAIFYRMDGRNRVLLARRNLPWPVGIAFLADWLAITIVRERSVAAVRAWLGGFAEGWRMDPGPRQPLSLGTMWQMTRIGRPPII